MSLDRYEKHQFTSDGVMIAYWDMGSPTGVPILLIHGFASNVRTNWSSTGWIERLVAEGFRVIAFDNRGHGQSEKLYDTAAYGAPLMAQDAVRLLDHLKIPQAHVMGYSMGARITGFLAVEHGSRLLSATMAGLGINMIRGLGNPEPIARALDVEDKSTIRVPAALNFREFAEHTKSDLKALAACIRSSHKKLTEEMVGSIACPTLVVTGDKDVISGDGAPLAAMIPNARHVNLPGRDHMKAVPDVTYKQAVVDFVKGLGT